MTPDFRALCAELVAELNGYKVVHANHDTDLIDRATLTRWGAHPGTIPPHKHHGHLETANH